MSSSNTTKNSSSKSSKSSAPASGGMGNISPRALFNMFLERWWIGLIIGTAAAVGFVLAQPKPEPMYYTEVQVLFEPQKDQVIGIKEVVENTASNAMVLNLHLEKMASRTFFEYFQNSFSPKEIEQIQSAYRDPLNPSAQPPSLAAILNNSYRIEQKKSTTIIKIGVTNKDPEAAALIANRFARKYMEFSAENVESTTNSAILWLKNQAEEKRKEVEEMEKARQRYRAEHNMAALGENKNIVQQKIGLISDSLAGTQLTQTNLNTQIETIEDYRKNGKNIFELQAIAGFGSVPTIHAEIENLKTARVLLEDRYGEEHPQMKQNALAMANAQERLNANINLAIAEIKQRYAQAKAYEIRLRKEYAEAEKQAQELDKTNLDYELLSKEAESKANTYQAVISRLNETTMVSQLNNANIKILDKAPVPNSPSSGTPKQVIMQTVGIGFVLFLGIPIGLGFLDTRVKTAHDIESGLNQIMLGGIKEMKKLSETERANVFRMNKDDAINEAYRGVFSEVEIRSTIPFPKRILVTSSIPGEGKSLTAANLAAVFAAHGKKTLLVDCDLRRPTLRRYFGAPSGVGLLPWLREFGRDANVVIDLQKLGTIFVAPNLDLLPAGDSTKNPTEVIDQIAHCDLFNKLSKHYDLIIVDTPPSAVFPDALLLSRFCAELIYVCRFKTIRRSVIGKTIDKFVESGIAPLGIVLNCMPQSSAMNYGYDGYGAYSAAYYKSYQGEKEEKS